MRKCYYLLVPLWLCGCRLGPNYQRPAVAVPAQYKAAPAPATAGSLADAKWPELLKPTRAEISKTLRLG